MARSIVFLKRSLASLLLGYGIIILVTTLYPFSFIAKNNCIPQTGGGIRFSSPAIMYTDYCPDVFLKMRRFTILFHFAAGSDSASAAGTILSSSVNSYDQNFSIQQRGTALVFRLFKGVRNEPYGIYSVNGVQGGKPAVCGIVYDGDILRWYINGVKKSEWKIGRIDFSSWDRNYPLVVGSEANGYHPWEGVLYSLSVYDKPVPQAILRDPKRSVRGYRPVLSFDFNFVNAGYIRSQGIDSSTALYIPKEYVPYRRTILLESETALWKRRLYFRDIVANILMFMPLGFLAGMLMTTMVAGKVRIMSTVGAAGLLFSLCIELLQVYLPGRFSSISDVLSNTAGALIGVLLFFLVLRTMVTEKNITP